MNLLVEICRWRIIIMKKILVGLLCTVSCICLLWGCGSAMKQEEKESKNKIEKEEGDDLEVDYEDEIIFEEALNDGKDVRGKILTFTVNNFVPDSVLGPNIWAGKHLNFFSNDVPDVEKGDGLQVKIDAAYNNNGHWYIFYELIDVLEKNDDYARINDESDVGKKSDNDENTNKQKDENDSKSTGTTILDNRDKNSDDKSTTVSKPKYDETDFEIKEYLYENYGRHLYFIVVTNNSDDSVKVEGNATAKDADGNILAVDSMRIYVVGPGETTIGYFSFSNAENMSSVEYELTYGEPTYTAVLNDVSSEIIINNKNVIVSATNNGDKSIDYLEAYALFFDADGNVVYNNYTYISDSDGELKAGSTLSKQIDCYKDFDNVEVYFIGKRY